MIIKHKIIEPTNTSSQATSMYLTALNIVAFFSYKIQPKNAKFAFNKYKMSNTALYLLVNVQDLLSLCMKHALLCG
jgi:hypothetical protein